MVRHIDDKPQGQPKKELETLPIRKSMYPSPPDKISMEAGPSGDETFFTIGPSSFKLVAAENPAWPEKMRELHI